MNYMDDEYTPKSRRQRRANDPRNRRPMTVTGRSVFVMRDEDAKRNREIAARRRLKYGTYE